MDKQKQIEEMAKELCPHYDNGNCYYEVTEVCECCFGCEFCWAISQVLNAGYRKIPEGAVVLTEGEYSDMLSDEVETIERDIAEYWATEDVTKAAKELHKDGYRKLDDHAILVLRKAKYLEQKLRKETAEKFAERLKELVADRNCNEDYEWEDVQVDGQIFIECVDEICKEISDGKV